jgi:hypothetical protein
MAEAAEAEGCKRNGAEWGGDVEGKRSHAGTQAGLERRRKTQAGGGRTGGEHRQRAIACVCLGWLISLPRLESSS